MKFMTLLKKGYVRTLGMGTAAASALSVSAFAAESEIATAMQSGLDAMKTDLFALFAIVLPAGLLIFGAFFGVKKAISMLRSASGGG